MTRKSRKRYRKNVLDMDLKGVYLGVLHWLLDAQSSMKHEIEQDGTRSQRDRLMLLTWLDTMLPYTGMAVTLVFVLGAILSIFVLVNAVFFLVYLFVIR